MHQGQTQNPKPGVDPPRALGHILVAPLATNPNPTLTLGSDCGLTAAAVLARLHCLRRGPVQFATMGKASCKDCGQGIPSRREGELQGQRPGQVPERRGPGHLRRLRRRQLRRLRHRQVRRDKTCPIEQRSSHQDHSACSSHQDV